MPDYSVKVLGGPAPKPSLANLAPNPKLDGVARQNTPAARAVTNPQADQDGQNETYHDRLEKAHAEGTEEAVREYGERFDKVSRELAVAEAKLADAQRGLTRSIASVKDSISHLNELRVIQDKIQDAAGVSIAVGGFFVSGGTSVFLFALGTANSVARPGAAVVETVGKAVAKRAIKDGAGKVIGWVYGDGVATVGKTAYGVVNLGQKALEYLKPADLLSLGDVFENATAETVDALSKYIEENQHLLEKYGPGGQDYKLRMKDWKEKIEERDKWEEEVRQKRSERNQILGSATGVVILRRGAVE